MKQTLISRLLLSVKRTKALRLKMLLCLVGAFPIVGYSEDKKSDLEALLRASESVQVENALLKSIPATHVCAEVVGKIDQISVKEGDRVQEKQTIAKVDDESVQRQLIQNKIAITIARLKHKSEVDTKMAESKSKVAKNELERANHANSRVPDAYPLKEIDRLKLVYETSLLEIQRAQEDRQLRELDLRKTENDHNSAQEILARHNIVAPVGGTVISVAKRKGEWVEPGTEVCQVLQMERLIIEGFVAAIAPTKLSVSQAVVGVQVEGKEFLVPARVSYVYPEINPLTNQIRVQLEIQNPEALFVPGMKVRAAISMKP